MAAAAIACGGGVEPFAVNGAKLVGEAWSLMKVVRLKALLGTSKCKLFIFFRFLDASAVLSLSEPTDPSVR